MARHSAGRRFQKHVDRVGVDGRSVTNRPFGRHGLGCGFSVPFETSQAFPAP